MSAESELYAALSGHAPLTALVSTRIYPDAIPEDKALPAVVFSRAGTDPVFTVHGLAVAETVRFQIAAWGATRTAAQTAADAVQGALNAAKFPPVNRSSAFDGELGLYADVVETDWFTNL